MNNVCITGIGLVSCLGIGAETNFAKLKAEETGIANQHIFNTNAFVGALPMSNNALKKTLGFDEGQFISRTALLGLLAAKEAWQDAQFADDKPAAFINGSTVGGMDLSENYFASFYKGQRDNPRLLAMHDLGTISNFIAENVSQFNYINTISTACSSGANAIMIGSQMIECGLYDRVLVGGTDALSEFTLQGFRSLMVYSDAWCQPFDAERKGLNLGEGAAYLVLEKTSSALESNKNIYGYVSGSANTNDAYHATGTSPDGLGAQLAMKNALRKAKLAPSNIDYINAHGTATDTNDSSEFAAMQGVFGDALPKYSSTKSFTGHTLAASGAIEACISLASINQQYIFPNINLQHPIDLSESLICRGQSAHINHVLSNSFGFGGNCTSLIFSKHG